MLDSSFYETLAELNALKNLILVSAPVLIFACAYLAHKLRARHSA